MRDALAEIENWELKTENFKLAGRRGMGGVQGDGGAPHRGLPSAGFAVVWTTMLALVWSTGRS